MQTSTHATDTDAFEYPLHAFEYTHTDVHQHHVSRKFMSQVYKRGKDIRASVPNLKEESKQRRQELISQMRERAKKATSTCNHEVYFCGRICVHACACMCV